MCRVEARDVPCGRARAFAITAAALRLGKKKGEAGNTGLALLRFRVRCS